MNLSRPRSRIHLTLYPTFANVPYTMPIYLAHRIKLKPNAQARNYFARASGVARFAYNWALGKWKEDYQNGIKHSTTGFDLVKDFNSTRKEEYPWTYDVTKWACQKPIQDLGNAFQRFFDKKARYPRFKKKGRCRDSFYLGVKSFKVEGRKLHIPKLGWV
jgi:putative transposase